MGRREMGIGSDLLMRKGVAGKILQDGFFGLLETGAQRLVSFAQGEPATSRAMEVGRPPTSGQPWGTAKAVVNRRMERRNEEMKKWKVKKRKRKKNEETTTNKKP
jgi:hypothetical protein